MRGSSFGYLIKEGARSLYANRLISFASIGTLVACMLLIGASMLFSMNVNEIVGYVEQINEMVAYVEDGVDEAGLEEIEASLELIDNIDMSRSIYVDKETALQEQKELLGDNASLLEGLEGDENPLPNSFRLKLRDLSQTASTEMQVDAIEGIESVRAPSEVAEILTSIRHAVSAGGMFIVALLIAVSLVIIANTIKVTVFNRRKEISIMKYVGATDTFIRLPFFVEGFLLGLISAMVAFGLLWVGYDSLLRLVAQNPSAWIQQASQSLLPFQEMALRLFIWFAAGGIGVGVFGSMFFVNKYLKV